MNKYTFEQIGNSIYKSKLSGKENINTTHIHMYIVNNNTK